MSVSVSVSVSERSDESSSVSVSRGCEASRVSSSLWREWSVKLFGKVPREEPAASVPALDGSQTLGEAFVVTRYVGVFHFRVRTPELNVALVVRFIFRVCADRAVSREAPAGSTALEPFYGFPLIESFFVYRLEVCFLVGLCVVGE